MEQNQNSRKGKHLTRVERMVIERMSRGGIPRTIPGFSQGIEGTPLQDGKRGKIEVE
ncbi:hypothetical protein [Kiritimatiella glycovorans]|uniref:Uncharacterized protein n=1 Tax=Kiritimatiella glycovorans TaxID=1307763 RepID=A0A0G3EFQ8_9BACT|nr:hypothetical protein [Kiritimatiella glycovorans]AKJ63635.1 hypothetical protein L21SP4_00354 [Kiritimatiella glycovorans]